MDQNTVPDNNTNPQNKPLTVSEFAKQYNEGTLPELGIDMPNTRVNAGTATTFSDEIDAYYYEMNKQYQQDAVKEEYDNILSAGGKFIDATLANAFASIWDTVGAFDIGDWRVPEMLGVGTALNTGFKFWDDYVWGDGQDEVGNWFTRRADLLRNTAAKNSNINLGNGWLDGLDYVLNTSANVVGSVGGFVLSGLATGGLGAALRVPKIVNTISNAWLMTEATGLSIAEGVYNRVYDEVAGKLDPSYQSKLDKVYQEALQEAMQSNLFSLDAEAAAQEAVRQFKKEFDAQNPSVGKIARESAAKGADASVKAAAPLFLLNITTAGLFTKGLYNPRNILSAPSRVTAKTVLTEGGQEFAEEGIFERRAEDLGYNVGVKGSYTNEDLWNTIVNYDTLESGLIGFISGGLMGGAVEASTYKDRNEKYNTQQERIKEENRIGEIVGRPELIDEVTNLQKNIFQVIEMGKQVDRLNKQGKEEEARALSSRMLAVQAAEAFKAGTTENLIANYEKIAKDPSAKVEVKQKATQAIAEIKEMEGVWKKTMGKYDNDVEVFFNRVNKIELGKVQKELGIQIAEQKILANEAVQAALKKGETSLTADIVEKTIDEYNNVVSDEKVGEKQLDYDLNNLSENPYTDSKERSTYDGFRSHVTKNVEAVRQLMDLQNRLGETESNLADNESTYNKITSPEYKKSLKNERQLYKVFKAGQAELESREGTDEYMPLVNQIMKKYKNSILPERFEMIKDQLDYKNEVVKVSRTLSKTQAITNRYGKDDDAEPVMNLDTNNQMTSETAEPKANNSVMLNAIASKIATGRKNELSAEENEFLVTYAQQVEKRVKEIQQDPNAATTEPLVDEGIDDAYTSLLNDLEQAITDSDLASEPTAETLSPNETASLVETPTLSSQEQSALDSFKGEVKKQILHRTIGPNYKSVVESLIKKGLITETKDSYVKAGETAQSIDKQIQELEEERKESHNQVEEIGIEGSGFKTEAAAHAHIDNIYNEKIAKLKSQQTTTQNNPAQNTLNNILSSDKFIATEEGLVLQLKEPTREEEKDSFKDAIALLKEKIKNNELSGYTVSSFKDPFTGVNTFKISKPITKSFLDTSDDAVSAQPNSYNEEGVSNDKKEEIKNIVSNYVENMEETNGKFPTFEEFVRHFAKVAGKTKADKYFHILHSGWKMNKYPEVTNPMVIWEKIFQDYNTLASRLSELADEVSSEGVTLDSVKKQTEEQIKVDDIKSDQSPMYQDPDTKKTTYTSNSFSSNDERPKIGYSIFESSLKYDVTSEGDDTIVATEYDNTTQKLKDRSLVNPFVLLNYNEIKPGSELEVVIPNERDLMTMVMPVRYESGPLKDAIQTDESGKRLTTTFGEWLKVKLEQNPEFRSTQEYRDRIPMLLKYKGEYVGAVSETVWYNETNFRGNIKEAQSNVREIRNGALSASNNGKSFNVRVTEVKGGVYEPMKLKTPKKIVDANPEAHVGVLVRMPNTDKFGFYVNNKLFTPKVIGIENIIESIKNDNRNPNYTPIDVRPWGLDEDGNLMYKAFPSAKMPINKEQQNTIFNTLYALLTIKAPNLTETEKSKAKQLQNTIQSINKLDITSFNGLGDFLKQFIIMPNLTPNNLDSIKAKLASGTETDLTEVGKIYANMRNNSFKVNGQIPAGKIGLPYIVLQSGADKVTNIIFGKTGDSEAMVISPKDFGSDTFNAKLKELKDALGAYELNVSIKDNGPVLYVNEDFKVEQTSSNYSEFLRNNLYTFVDSLNIGSGDNPMYVTRIQPSIYIEPSSTVSRKENQVSVSKQEPTVKEQQKNNLVAETSTEEDFKDAVVKAEEEGWEFQGVTLEEKADDLKKVVEENNAESTEIVNDYLEAKETSIEQTEEFNKLIKQSENQVKWVNEYFNNDGSVNQSYQPAELADSEVEAMDKDVMKIRGLAANHQTKLAEHITIEIAQAIKQDEKIDVDKLRKESKDKLATLLNANKELLQETLAKLKAVPNNENIASVTNLINKYEYALAKIDLVLENSDIVFDQALSFILKDAGAKLVDNKVETKEKDERVVNDQDDIDTDESEEGFSYESENTIGNENYSKTSLEENHKSSISFELRRFMRGIQETNPKSKLPELGPMGVPLYVGFDAVFDTLQTMLADSPMDFATMMDILELNKDKQPWIPQVIERLKESSNEIKNQFVTTMGKHALSMEFLMYSFDKNGKVTLRVTNTNSAAISVKLGNQWNNNLLTSALINEDKTVNYNVAKQLYDVYKDWMFTLPEVKSKLSSSSLVPAISEEIKKGSKSRLLQSDGFSFSKDTKPKEIPNTVFDELLTYLKEDKKVTVNGVEYRVSTDGNKITISPLKKSLVAKAISNTSGDAFIKLNSTDQQEVIDSVQEWMSMFGIELADNAIRNIFENGFMHKNSLINITEFFTATESGGGVIGLLGDWLNKVVSGDPEDTIDISKQDPKNKDNNPLNNSAIKKTLAFLQSKYTTDISVTSFRDGKKSIYGFTAFKFITDRAKELVTNKQLRDDLRETSFAKNSMWLSFFNDFDTINRLNFEDIFSVSHLGLTAMKELGTKVYRDNAITALSDIDHEYTKIGLFQDLKQGTSSGTYGSGKIGLRVSRFLFPTMSDKSTMTIVKTLGLNLADKVHYDVNEEGNLVPNETVLRVLFEQLVLPEAQRMAALANTKERQTNIENYDKGAKMFLFLPKLNTLNITAEDKEVSLTEVLTTPGVDINKVFNRENELKIFKELETYITSLVNDKIKVWENNGYITSKEELDYENNLLDDKYWNSIKNSAVADGEVNSKDKAFISAFDFEINQMLANVNAFMTMIGDPALYYKVKEDSKKSYVEKSKETFDNVGKRLAAMIAPGSKLADSENEQYTQIFLEDRKSISQNIDFITKILDNKTFDRKEYNKLVTQKSNSNDPDVNEKFNLEKKAKIRTFLAQYPNSKKYFEIESTDAQEYTTWQEHLHILEKLGRLNDATVGITPQEIREAKEMFANEVPLDKMSDRQKDILKKVLQPIKPVYTGQIFDKEQDVMRMMYIKSSSFPLIPQVTKGLELDNLRMLMESIQDQGNTENNSPRKYVRASYQTANKVGAIAKPLSLFDEEGRIKNFASKDENGKTVYNTEEALKASLVLNRKDFKIQLDVPYKSLKRDADTISMGTQLTKLLFGNGIMDLDGFEYNGKPINGKDLQAEFNKTFLQLADLKKEQLFDELGIDVKTGQPIDLKETFNKLQKLLKDEAVNRGYSKQAIESLELEISNVESELMSFDDVRFKMPLWMSPNSDKFESLLNAIVSNRLVKIKMSGNSYVAGSEEGFKFQTDLKNINESKIVWTSKWNNQELQGTNYDENGKIKFAQVLAPSKFRKQDGTLIDLFEKRNGDYIYVTETESGFRLKEDMIAPELLSLTSFRIPTSGHNSASQIEIVGFLPQEAGDLMVVPKNFTTQKGLDFDVDKENTYQLWHTTDENGKISILKQGDKEKLLQNKIINIHKSVLSNPSKAVQKKINGVLTTEYAEDQAKQIDTWLSEAKDDQYFTPLSSEYQKKKLISAASGKLGTGAYSLDVTSHSLFEQAKANGNPITVNAEVMDKFTGKPMYPAFVIKWGENEGMSKGVLGNEKTVDGERTIAEVLSELQNIAVDNEKLQVMGKVNLNSYTLDVSKAIAMLGFDKSKVTGNSIQFTFLSQPILLDYVKEMANADSNLVDFSIGKQDQVIKKLLEKYGNKDYQLGYEQDQKESINLSIGALEDQLQSTSIDNRLQLAVLNRFLELNKIGGAIRGIQTTINVDSKGLSKSISENTEKINSIINMFNNPRVDNAGKLIGDIIVGANEELENEKLKQGYQKFGNALIKPTTISGAFAVNALSTADMLWSKHFPYNSPVVNAIVDQLNSVLKFGEASEIKKAQKRKQIVNEIKKYLNSVIAAETIFKNTDAQAERERLFIANSTKDSLASYLKDVVAKYPVLAGNKLIQRLDFTEINKDGKPSFIKFNNASNSIYDEDSLNNGLLDLMQRNIPLDSFNGEPYTSRKLAQDLISYSMLEGGVQEAIQFVKFVPLAYLDAKGFTQGVRDIDFNTAFDKFGINPDNTDMLGTFAIQFAQNNPQLLPKLDTLVDKFKAQKLAKFPVFSEIQLGKDKPELISFRVDENYVVYLKQGKDYVQIPRLGTFGMAEYNNKPGITKSVITTTLPAPIITPKVNNGLNPVSESTKVTNQQRYDLDKSNLKLTLNKIADDKNIPESLSALAKALLESVDNATLLKIEDLSSEKARGVFRRSNNQIGIDIKQAQGASDTELARTILKETVHSVTDKEILKYVDNNHQLKTNDAPPHIKALLKLFFRVQAIPEFQQALESIHLKRTKQIDEKLTNKENEVYYGGYNILEFVEMILTQPEFQQEMAKVKTADGTSLMTLFKDFFNKLFKALGMEFESDTVAAQAIENALILIDEKGKLKKEPVVEVQTKKNQPTIIQPGLELYKNALTKEEQKQFYEFGKSVLEENGYNPFPQYVMASAGQMEWSPEIVIGKDGKEYKRQNNYNTKIISHKKKVKGSDGVGRWAYHYYLSNLDGSEITPIPNNIISILEKITGQDMSDYDTVLINLYPVGRTLGWHVDVSEDNRTMDRDIISVSIGADADFYYANTPDNFISGDPEKAGYEVKNENLKSGDVLSFGGKSRLISHTVKNVTGTTDLGSIDLSDSNVNEFFKGGLKLDNWRMNFTFRVADNDNNKGKRNTTTQQTQPITTSSTNFKTEDLKFKSSKLEEFTLFNSNVVKGYSIEIKGQPNVDFFIYKENKVGWTVIDNKSKNKFALTQFFNGSADTKKEVLESLVFDLNKYKNEEYSKKVLESIGFNFGIQPTTTEVSNPVKNDLLKSLEQVISIPANEVQLVDNIDFNQFEGYPNILDYLNNDLGIEVLEYTVINQHKDVIEQLLSEIEGDKNIYTLLDKIKSETDTKDLGLSSEVQPILTAPTSKEQDLLKKTENDPALKDYEILPGVTANEKQTEAIDKLNNFVRTPRDSSERYQSTFVLTGAAGTGKTTIVKKIIDSNPGKNVVGAALSNSAKKVLGKATSIETNTIASLVGIKLQGDGSFDVDKDFKAEDSDLAKADIVIIDESSMLSKEMLKLIYRIAPKNAKIIFMGDKAQLPPFKEDEDSKSFDLASKPEYSANLTQRMRQGETSPIVAYSDILRNETEKQNPRRTAIQRRVNNFDHTTNKGILFASKRQMNENMILDFKADVQGTKIITHTNKSRKQMNDIARLILWGKVGVENEYNIGEILTANGTNPILKVTNGDFYIVQDVRKINNAITINTGLGNQVFPGYELTLQIKDSDSKDNIITVKVLDSKSQQDVKAIQDSLYKSGNSKIAGNNKEKLVDIDYGYALTAYKAQGTTLNNVYVMEDDIVSSPMNNKQVNQAMYVAMTRAKNKAVIYSENQLTQDDLQGMTFDVSLQPATNEMYENQIDELTRKGIIKSKCD